jgi:hypothetical protein
MVMTGPRYDLLDFTQELTEQGNLFYIERLLVENNTSGVSVTPQLTFDNDTVVAFPSFSRTTRGFSEVSINRLGPLVSLELTNSAFASQAIGIFSLELHLRPVRLGINFVATGQKVEVSGRGPSVSNSIVFEINPFEFPEDARHMQPIPRRLYLDIQTDATGVTPVLVSDDGTETTLTTIVQTTRKVVEFSILAGRRLRAVRLNGDFSDAANVLYDIELDTYLPGNRRLSVG